MENIRQIENWCLISLVYQTELKQNLTNSRY